MKHRFQAFVVAVAAAAIIPTVTPGVALATVDGQRQEVQRVVDKLDKLGAEADILLEDYNEALVRQEDLGKEIEASKGRIAEKQTEVDELRGELSDVAVASFTGSGNDVMGPLFSKPTNYSDKLRSDQYRSIALDVGSVSTDDLDEVLDELAKEKAALDSKLEEQGQLVETIKQRRAEVDKLHAQYEQERKDAEAKLGQLIAEEEARRAAEAWAAAQAAAAAQQQAAANSNSGNSSGSSGNSNSRGNSSSGSSSNNSNSGGNASSGNSNSGGNSSSGNSNSGGNSSSNNNSSNSGSSGSSGGTTNKAVSGLAGTAVAKARSQLGVPYRYAASSPGEAFDCSGLTSWAWGQAGIRIPRVSRDQAAALPRVSPGSAQPGDLVFFYSPVSHVGIYIGGGQMIHAPYTGSVVSVSNVSWNKVTAVGRPG